MKRYSEETKDTVLKSLTECDLFNEKNPKAAIEKISRQYKIGHSTIYTWYMRAKKDALDSSQFPENKDDTSKKAISIHEYYRLISQIKTLSDIEKRLKESNENLIISNKTLMNENSEIGSKFRSLQYKIEDYINKFKKTEDLLIESQQLIAKSQTAIETLVKEVEEKNAIISSLKDDIIFKDKAIITFAMQILENKKLNS